MTGDAVLRCPHCGGVLLVQPAALDVATANDRARAVRTVRTKNKTKERTKSLTKSLTKSHAAPDGAAVPVSTVSTVLRARERDQQACLPLPPTLATKPIASIWKRAIAIAFAVLEECADGASQTEAFKARCAEQGIPYGEPGTGADRRPLYARALDYALEARRRRAAVGR